MRKKDDHATLATCRVASPVGDIVVAFRADTVVALEFADQQERMSASLRMRFGAVSLEEPLTHTTAMQAVCKRLRAYFDGDISALEQIEVDLGGTPFQRQVWQQLRRIAPGRTLSYGELARRVGRERAARAVGAANGSNPIALIVPCHRAIGGDGSLTGYAGGLERKRWLLQHEGVLV